MLSELTRDVPIGSRVTFWIKDGRQISGVLKEVSIDFVILEQDEDFITIHENIVAGLEYAEDPSIAKPKPSVMFPDERNKSIKTVRSQLSGAIRLTICDPYIFELPKETSEQKYIKEFISVLPLATLQYVDIFCRASYSEDVSKGIKSELKRHNIEVAIYTDNSIHDRVWMVNSTEAFLVGTSFGGIGNKVAFILDLPKEDVKIFKSYLNKIRRKAK